MSIYRGFTGYWSLGVLLGTRIRVCLASFAIVEIAHCGRLLTVYQRLGVRVLSVRCAPPTIGLTSRFTRFATTWLVDRLPNHPPRCQQTLLILGTLTCLAAAGAALLVSQRLPA